MVDPLLTEVPCIDPIVLMIRGQLRPLIVLPDQSVFLLPSLHHPTPLSPSPPPPGPGAGPGNDQAVTVINRFGPD